MKEFIKNIVLSLFIICVFASIAEAKKLKLFINEITPETGVSKSLSVKIKDYFSLSIFENFNKEYQVITEDDIKIMYKKAAELQAAGCDDQTCVLQIAEAIDADEIIYGAIKRMGSKLRLSVQNLKRDKATLEIGKKSIIDILFYESQLEWYSKEIAKKLINPGYFIDPEKAPSIITGKFRVDKIDIKTVKGVDINTMLFRTKDESISKLIDYLKEIIDEGDKLFLKKEYSGSREKYREVISKINSRIIPRKRRKIASFTEDVYKRITSTYINEFKIKIEEVDEWLKRKELMDEDIVIEAMKKYKAILALVREIPESERRNLNDVRKTIVKRLSSVYSARISVIEKDGDNYYNEYKFKLAIDKYDLCIEMINRFEFKTASLTLKKDKLEKKKRVCLETGASWLENRVRSYCEQAEYFNIRDKTGRAKDALEKAGNLIAVNSIFLNSATEELYEEYGRTIGHEVDIGERTKFFEESRDNIYGTVSLTFMSLSVASFGGGYYFNMRLGSISSDYNSLADRYELSTDFDEATKLHNDMTVKKEEADKAALYRNIFYGAGVLFFGVSAYFTYKYFLYRSMESKLEASDNKVFYMPVAAFSYGRPGRYNAASGGYFLGAVMAYRF